METGKKKIMTMNFLTEDLWTVILARLPLKSIATSKLVCKKWLSILESRFLRELFLSHHQNSHSSWSLILRDKPDRDAPEEVLAHYGCEVWGLPRSLGSYVSSFIHGMTTKKEQKDRVLAYTDVGLILVSSKSVSGDDLASYYVANPIPQQYVKIPPLPHVPTVELFKPSGLVTRIENGDVLGYKVVMMDTSIIEAVLLGPILLAWEGCSLDNKDAVVSHDFYATGTESDRCRVITFPDVEYLEKFTIFCTTSQGFLKYIYIFDEGNEDKLRAWRLKSGEWEQVSQISPAFLKNSFSYFLRLAMNPFDGDTLYLRSGMRKCLVSINLYNKHKFGLHNNLERTSDSLTLSFTSEWDPMESHSFPRLFSRVGCIESLPRRHKHYMLVNILKKNGVNNKRVCFDAKAKNGRDPRGSFCFEKHMLMLMKESELNKDLIKQAKIFH